MRRVSLRPPVTKWLKQHPVETELRGVAELRQPKCHSLMAGFRLGPVGAEQAVPPGQIEPEVAIGLASFDRVVNAMHLRGDDKPAQNLVDPCGQPHVAMV